MNIPDNPRIAELEAGVDRTGELSADELATAARRSPGIRGAGRRRHPGLAEA